MGDKERALLIAAGGGFGDTLLATLCASALRSRYAAVDAVVLPAHLDALLHGAEVERIFSAARPFGELAAELRAQRYAAAVVTWANAYTARLAWRSGAPIRVGQARRLYSALFTHRVVVRSERGDTATHWSEILLDYPRALGCETALPWPRFEVAPADEAEAAAVLGTLGIRDGYIVVAPTSAAGAGRPRWPLVGWSRVASALRERYGCPIVVTGSAAETPLAARLALACGGHDASAKTTWGGYAALVRNARAYVGMHSAPMHVAASVGTPTVGVFPLRADFPERWRALGPRVAIVRPSYPCPPGRAHRMETCATYDCVAKLDVDAIVRAVDAVLAGPHPSLRTGIAA